MSEENEEPTENEEVLNPAALKLEELAEKVNDVRTMASTMAMVMTTEGEYPGIHFLDVEEIAHQAWMILVLMSEEDVLKNGQLALRSCFDALEANLAFLKNSLVPQVVAAGEDLFKMPIANILTDVWEDLTKEKADRRVAVLDPDSGVVHLMDSPDNVQDGLLPMAPLYTGVPMYLRSVEALCAKHENDKWSFCKKGAPNKKVIDLKIKNLHLSLQAGIVMHMVED